MPQKLAVLNQTLTNSNHTPSSAQRKCPILLLISVRDRQTNTEEAGSGKNQLWSAVRESGVLSNRATVVAALSRLALIIHTPSVPFTVSPLLAVALKAFDMDTSAAFLTALFQFAVSGLRIDCSCFGPSELLPGKRAPRSFRKSLHQIKWKSGGE